MNEAASVLTDGLESLILVLWLVVAGIAIFRFRATPTGVLLPLGIGLNLAGMACTRIFYDGESRVVEDVDAFMTQLIMLHTVRGSLYVLGWITFAVGLAFVPFSVRRLTEKRDQSAPGAPM